MFLFDSDAKLIANVRRKLKLFENGYGKAKKMILNIDYLQDQIFCRQLKCDIMRKWNINYNLGLYTDSYRRVICNTQYAYYAMQDDVFIKSSIATVRDAYERAPTKFDLSDNVAYDYSYKCGQLIDSVVLIRR